MSTPKQPKLNERMREERIKELEEDLADISSRIAFKDKQCSQAATTRNYMVCDKLMEEIMEWKTRKREIEKYLKSLFDLPPHADTSMGRQKCLLIYLEQISVCYQLQKQADNTYTTNFRNLSLLEYTNARSIFCGSRHVQNLQLCSPLSTQSLMMDILNSPHLLRVLLLL